MERQKEIIVNTRIGRQSVSLDKVIRFPRGLIGFEHRHDFALLQIRENSAFLVLQSLDDPRLGLLVADPYMFLSSYEIRIGDAEQALLQVEKPEDVTVLVTVSIPPGQPEKTTLYLSGPILFNHTAKIGMQVPQVDGASPSHVCINLRGKKEDEAK